VVKREKADIGVLITIEHPSKPMQNEASKEGFYKSPWGLHPKLQILTVDAILDGNGIDYPKVNQGNITFAIAEKAVGPTEVNSAFQFDGPDFDGVDQEDDDFESDEDED
jgi:hypothetical protein